MTSENTPGQPSKIPMIVMLSVLTVGSYFSGPPYREVYLCSTYLFGYLLFLCVLSLFNRNRIVKRIHTIVGTPLWVFAAFIPVFSSFSSILMALSIILTISLSLAIGLPVKMGYPLSLSAHVYLTSTFFAIISTTMADRIIKFYHYLQAKDYRNFSETLALKSLNQQKIKYLLFLLYFFALILFNVNTFIDNPLKADPKVATAILQSFATYLAFDRIIVNFHLLKNKTEKNEE